MSGRAGRAAGGSVAGRRGCIADIGCPADVVDRAQQRPAAQASGIDGQAPRDPLDRVGRRRVEVSQQQEGAVEGRIADNRLGIDQQPGLAAGGEHVAEMGVAVDDDFLAVPRAELAGARGGLHERSPARSSRSPSPRPLRGLAAGESDGPSVAAGASGAAGRRRCPAPARGREGRAAASPARAARAAARRRPGRGRATGRRRRRRRGEAHPLRRDSRRRRRAASGRPASRRRACTPAPRHAWRRAGWRPGAAPMCRSGAPRRRERHRTSAARRRRTRQ